MSSGLTNLSLARRAATLFYGLLSFTLFITIFYTTLWTFVQVYQVPTQSMFPTLKNGDHVVAFKFVYKIRMPFTEKIVWNVFPIRRGDVVIFRKMGSPYYVKRVVALAGDHVKMDQGLLFINGQAMEQSKENSVENLLGVKHFLTPLPKQITESSSLAHSFSETIIPEGKVFLLGDNRAIVSDSRVWGSIEINDILAKVGFILFSNDDWNRVGTLIY